MMEARREEEGVRRCCDVVATVEHEEAGLMPPGRNNETQCSTVRPRE